MFSHRSFLKPEWKRRFLQGTIIPQAEGLGDGAVSRGIVDQDGSGNRQPLLQENILERQRGWLDLGTAIRKIREIKLFKHFRKPRFAKPGSLQKVVE